MLSTKDSTVIAVGVGMVVLLIAQGIGWGGASSQDQFNEAAKAKAIEYFDVWNAHDVSIKIVSVLRDFAHDTPTQSAALENFFVPSGSLRDW